MDRLTSLTVFAQVVDSGGFAAAAKRLGMSSSMVSSHVQALEARLGVRLLNRTTRRVSVTETGAAYHARCTQILAELEEADRLASALQTTLRGTLRVHLTTPLVPFVAPVVDAFLGQHDAVAVQLIVGDRAVDLIEEGYDLAIRTVLPPDSSLIVRQIAGWRHILSAAPDYLAMHGAPRSLAAVADHNCLRYAYYPFGDGWRFTGPDGAPAMVRVSGNLVSNSAEMLRLAALRGRGIFLAPSFVINEDLASGALVPLLSDYVPVPLVINAVYPHRHHLSAKVRVFLDLVAERIAEHRKWLDPRAA